LKKIINFAGLFTLAGLIIALDQWAKMLVRTLPLGDTWLPAGMEWLMPYARIIHWYNTGAAFGSFAGYGWIFTILAFVVVGLIIYYFPQVDDSDWWLKVAMGMQMGGALGNVVDRLTNHGQVTDFISVGNFAVFNVADASISTGVVILLIGVWIKELKERKQVAAETPAAMEPDQTLGEASPVSPAAKEPDTEVDGDAGEPSGE
jgi:signal peptidase II